MVKWLVLLAVCVVTGCAGPAVTTGAVSPTPSASPPTPTPTPTPTLTPTPTPTPTRTPLPKAADGTKLGSCADARCEVELAAGNVLRFAPVHDVSRFAIRSIRGDKVTWKLVLPDGGNVSMSAAEHSSYRCVFGSPMTCSGFTRGVATIVMNGVTLRLLAFDHGHAVARVAPKR